MRRKIRKIIKAIKKRLKRVFSHMPQRKFFFQHYCSTCPVRDNVILIESFHGQNISDSGLVLAKEILRSYPGKYKIYFATEAKTEHQKFVDAIGLDVELIDVNTFAYTKILATAKYILTNASLPIYFIKRKEQVYLQMWHGTPLKTLGKKMRLGIESLYIAQHSFLQADYLSEPNAFTRDVIMEDYNLTDLYTGKVVMAGYPRNEIFMNPEAGKELRKKLGLEDKKIYAYMPTWRGTSNHTVDVIEYESKAKQMLKIIDGELTDDQIFYVKFHPILRDAVPVDKYKHIRRFPQDIDTYEFINCVDALVTDYSSVFFDFSLTKKPVVLFMYDYDEYMHDRGMRMDVKTLPFRQIYDAKELGECLREGACLNDSYTDTEYYKTFFKYDSPDISKKLLKLVLEGDPGDLEIIDYSHNCKRPLRVIEPEQVKGRSDFNTLAHVANDNTVVVLYKKWFKGEVSPILHDEFNDSFRYIITTYTPPRTYFEDLMANLGSSKAKMKIHQRDIQRCFPNLNIDPHYIKDYGCFDLNCKAPSKALEQVTLSDYTGTSKGFAVQYSLPERKTPLEAVIMRNDLEILSKRPLTDEEKAEHRVEFDIKSLIEDYTLYNKERCVFGVLCKDKENSEITILTFIDSQDISVTKKHVTQYSKAALYRCPQIITCNVAKDFFRVNLKRLMVSVNKSLQNRLTQYDLTPVECETALLPYFDAETGYMTVYVCQPEAMMDEMCAGARLRSIKTNANTCKMKVELQKSKDTRITGAVLKYRSATEDIEIPVKTEVTDRGDSAVVNLSVEFDGSMPLKEVFWDLRLLVEKYGYTHRSKVVYLHRRLKYKFFFTNCECRVDDEHIIFPYFGKKSVLCFCYREKTEYDNMKTRFKEMTAYFLYRFFGAFWRRKKIWIVFEKFCKTAQDNSYYFFKYCMEKLPEKEKKRIFYVIDKRSPDYENIKKYQKNVIQFMSIKHMLYCLAMNICISSDSTSHLYVWRSKPSVIRRAIKKKKEMFLQHGVIALKQVHNIFGKKSASPMTYFVTSSKEENAIIVNDFGYKPQNVPITGLCRWDVLEDKSDPRDRFVLLMPTWRSWLEEVSSQAFIESDYYENYSKLLTSRKLTDMLEKNNVKLVFYLHPKFAAYIDEFKDKMSSNVVCVPFGERPLNDLLMRCSMLITDYSSVCWDVLYQDKPVLFYQFDYERYDLAHGSYINMETDLMGERSTEPEELLKQLEGYINNGFEEKEEYKKRAAEYFTFRDDKNSRRVYEFLKSKGH